MRRSCLAMQLKYKQKDMNSKPDNHESCTLHVLPLRANARTKGPLTPIQPSPIRMKKITDRKTELLADSYTREKIKEKGHESTSLNTSTRVNRFSSKEYFTIEGKKIKLQSRHSTLHAENVGERCRGVLKKEIAVGTIKTPTENTVDEKEDKIELFNLQCRGAMEKTVEKLQQLTDKPSDVIDEVADGSEPSLQNKRRSAIKIQTPSRRDTLTVLDKTTYMIYRKSSTNTTEWKTMFVNFSQASSMQDKRRYSHRNSSFSSSASLEPGYMDLSLACKTPQQSPSDSPLCNQEFVFPVINKKN